MNSKQLLFNSITGFETNSCYSSARCEEYFDYETKDEKITILKEYAESVLSNYFFSDEDFENVYKSIEMEKSDTNDWFLAFIKLR